MDKKEVGEKPFECVPGICSCVNLEQLSPNLSFVVILHLIVRLLPYNLALYRHHHFISLSSEEKCPQLHEPVAVRERSPHRGENHHIGPIGIGRRRGAAFLEIPSHSCLEAKGKHTTDGSKLP